MSFDELWAQVEGLPNTAKEQVPGVLSENTKKKLQKKTPAQIKAIVVAAIAEVNHGSTMPLDILIKSKL